MEPDKEKVVEHTMELEYVGFWQRALASLVDGALLLLLVVPCVMLVSGGVNDGSSSDVPGLLQLLIWWLLPAAAVLWFWHARHATPGKMLISATIINERTGAPPTFWQYIGRYFAYFMSLVPLGLGFFWAGMDVRKQGWHDKMAGTLVVRVRKVPLPLEVGR